MTDKTKAKKGMFVIAAEASQFMNELTKFEDENIILEKFISSQIAQVPNPAHGLSGIKMHGQPEFITQVLITCVIFFIPKVSQKKEIAKHG